MAPRDRRPQVPRAPLATHGQAAATPGDHAVREGLDRVLSSPHFTSSGRLSALLRFLVEETLGGRGPLLKEARIGLEVFARPAESYDPALDPIVRVQMGRLRAKLRRYYEVDGAGDDVRIEIPVGSYVPRFGGNALAGTRPASRNPDESPDGTARLAVLPFLNMSPTPSHQYLCDGLTDELINRLARTPRLRVVARTSSFQFKEAARDIRDVGQQLGVEKVLEGSIRTSADRLRVTVQLINVADGCHLWSQRYDGELTDIFAIQERIAAAIQEALQARLLGTERVRHPGFEAYNHYLQGRFFWNRRTEQGLRAAIAHFEAAIAIDPACARAHCGLADCHMMLGMSAADAPRRSMPKAAESAARALELDAGLAEARTSRAAVRNCYDWDFAGAEREYLQSLATAPGHATTSHWLGLFTQAATGRFTAAAESLERARGMDPLSAPIIADLGLVHAFAGAYDEAARVCERALELDPHFHRPYWFLGLSLAWQRNHEAAERTLRKGLDLCPGRAFRARLLGALGFVYARWGRRDLADAVTGELAALGRTGYVPAFELAQIKLGSREHEAALGLVDDAIASRESFCIFLDVWPSFRPLRAVPRFRRLLSDVGLNR